MSTEDDRHFQQHADLSKIYTSLARIDERTKSLDQRMTYLDARLEEYITRHEFTPVKLIAFGFAGLILLSVAGALIATVVVKQ